MDQQMEVIAAKLDDLSSSPRTHVVEGENQILKDVVCVPSPTYIHVSVYVYVCIRMYVCVHVCTYTQ